MILCICIINIIISYACFVSLLSIIQRKHSTVTLTFASMLAVLPVGSAPSLIQKSRRNTIVLNCLILNFRHEWHIKTYCYTLKNKQRINKLSTHVYVICKYVVNRMSDFSLKSLIRLTYLQITLTLVLSLFIRCLFLSV